MDYINTGKSKLTIIPYLLDDANHFIKQYHRHHGPVVGHKFALAVIDEKHKIRGVTTVGRPVSRVLDDGLTLEVTRLCTDGCPNACSALYAAAWRTTRSLGYKRLITYILATEKGSSLKGAGWKLLGSAGGGRWNSKNRPRADKHPIGKKLIWEA